jgi:hypothetical protein
MRRLLTKSEDILFNILQEKHIKLFIIYCNKYVKISSVVIKLNDNTTDCQIVNKKIQQGYTLSPTLSYRGLK